MKKTRATETPVKTIRRDDIAKPITAAKARNRPRAVAAEIRVRRGR